MCVCMSGSVRLYMRTRVLIRVCELFLPLQELLNRLFSRSYTRRVLFIIHIPLIISSVRARCFSTLVTPSLCASKSVVCPTNV